MPTLSRATFATASAVRGQHISCHWALLAVLALALSGCMPATTQVAAADPADPAAKVAPVRYRSTIAPYSSLRPATPAPWRDRNGAVTPQPKQDR